jgi:protein tyrosine phosphatase (PTP) superfamily phosphohydrolase (DUF442 family)
MTGRRQAPRFDELRECGKDCIEFSVYAADVDCKGIAAPAQRDAMAQSVLPAENAKNTTRPRIPSRIGLLLKICAAAVLVMFVAECLRIFVGTNFHTVVPGKCYRSAQPTAAFLEIIHRTHGIGTIVNLRDENEDEPWYQEEKQAAKHLNLRLMNAGLSSKEQPPAVDFRVFVRAMKDAPEPILIHCANGNDRTGLASAVYLMMRTDTPLAEARGHLSLRYGHISWSKASCLHRILNSYETWLTDSGKTHSPDNFYYWGMNVYEQESPR